IMGLISIWWERFHQGTTGPEFAFTFVERILIASRSVWFYLGKLIFPSKLTFSYPKWEINVADPTQYVWLIGCLAVAVLLWLRRKHVGNGLVAGLVFFVAALFPTLGFFSLYTFRYTFVSDHYQYLACIGPIAIISWLLTTDWRKFSQARNVVLASIIIVLWVLTWRQGHIYKDSETLWSDNLAKNPVSWMAYNNLAAVLLKQGDAEKSLEYHKKALEICENPEAYIGLGAALTQLGRPQEAIPHLQRALKLRPNDPSTYYNMGIAFAAMGNTVKSIENYQKALEINPHYVKARNNLGSVLASQGNFKEAAEQYLNILNDNPNDDKAHTNLANVLAEVGKIDEAEQHYLYALTSNPNNETAHYNLARLFSAKGDLPNAIQHYREAIRLNPKNVNAHYNLACIYGMQNRLDKAIEEYRKAISLKPDFADAHKNLAVSLYFTSDYVGAWREVALAKKYGATPHPEFIKALSQKMPPP
ncbi:MAG: tetratricopeptide repeat protein, partial [Armatimonadota bacterium]|nr:tetratricopeptide repeat protein [Armatimonadota bacterium]